MLWTTLTAASLSAQLLVGPAGSGAPFPDIQSAIDVAAMGDTVLVLPGTYGPFDLDKPLTLVGSGSDVTEVYQPLPVAGPESGAAAHVHGIGPGQRASISGFRFAGDPSPLLARPLVSVWNCDGAVQFHDVQVAWGGSGSGFFPFDHWQLDLRKAALVQLDRAVVDGGVGFGGVGIELDASTLWASNSTVRGGDAGDRHGIRARGSAVFLAATSVHGGDTMFSTIAACTFPGAIDLLCGNGGTALALHEGSTVLIHGTATTELAGGAFVGLGICDCGGATGPSVAVDGASSASVFGSPSIASGTSIEPGGSLTESPTTAPVASVAPIAGQPGDLITATVLCEPSTPVIVFGAFPGTGLTLVPGFEPGAVLPIATVVSLGAGVSGPQGSFTAQVQIPASPALGASILALQGVAAGSLAGTSNGALVRVDP